MPPIHDEVCSGGTPKDQNHPRSGRFIKKELHICQGSSYDPAMGPNPVWVVQFWMHLVFFPIAFYAQEISIEPIKYEF